MTSPTIQRQVRFSSDIDEQVQQRADAAGLSVPAWMKRVIHEALDNTTEEAVRSELRAARAEQAVALDRTTEEIKSFVLEAVMGLGERLTSSQQDFLRQLIGQLPQVPRGPRHSSLFPNLSNQ